MRFRATKGTITMLGVGLAVMLVGFGSVLWLQRTLTDGAARVLHSRLDEVSDGQRIARRQALARNLLEEDRSRLRFLEIGVSDKAYVPTLLKQVEELGAATRNRVLGVRPQAAAAAQTRLQQRRDPESQAAGEKRPGETGPDGAPVEEPEEPYERLGIEVSIVGTYATSQDFIARLTRFPKIIAVDEVSIQPHRATSPREAVSLASLDVKIKVTAFVMKEKTAVSPGVKTASAAIGGLNP